MTLTWRGAAHADQVVNFGPLALIQPLLEQLDLAALIDRPLPPDPQLEFSHGQVLSLLLAARLCQPTALVNVSAGAARTGADLLWNLPTDRLNDDRLGRALDAFFDQRHSILAAVTAQALQLTALTLEHLHFDTTHLVFHGAYENSQPRPPTAWADLRGDAHLPPAHIGHGYLTDAHMIKVGVSASVDAHGALPVLSQCLDGPRQDRRAVREQFQLLQQHLPLPDELRMISDRGTFSADHVSRLYRQGYHVWCSARRDDFQAVYDAHAERRRWHEASYRSIEQHRRRETSSTLPREHDRLAVLKYALPDPSTGQPIPGRLIFVHSSADEKGSRRRRAENIATIRAGLAAIAAKVQRGHGRCQPETIRRQVDRLFGRRAAACYFGWPLEPLTPEEPAALPPPGPGQRRPRYRFAFTFDAALAQADARYDGLAVLYTTAPRTRSADARFTQFKRQNFVELLHHQWKTPRAVRPVFLKSPRRVEALVSVLPLALQAYQVLERRYRQTIAPDAPATEQRMTAESLLRQFQVDGLIVHSAPVGRVVHATPPTSRQRHILRPLGFPTPAQTLTRKLHPDPT